MNIDKNMFSNEDIISNCLIGKFSLVTEDDSIETSKTFSMEINKPDSKEIIPELLQAIRSELLFELDADFLMLMDYAITNEPIPLKNLEKEISICMFEGNDPMSIILPINFIENFKTFHKFVPFINSKNINCSSLIGLIIINDKLINCYSSLFLTDKIYIVKHNIITFTHKPKLLSSHKEDEILKINGHFSLSVFNKGIKKISVLK